MELNKQLTENVTVLKTILNAIPELLFHLDKQGTFLSFHQGDSRDLVMSPEEFVGRNVKDIFDEKLAGQFLHAIDQTLKDGSFEHDYVLYVGKQKYYTAKYSKLNENEVIGLVKDISAQKETEQALKESERRFSEIIEQTQTVVWEVDVNGVYTYISPLAKSTWGYDPEELTGKMHFYDLHPENEREEFKRLSLEIFDRHESFVNLINKVVCKDGRIIYVSTNGKPVYDDEHHLTGYRGSDNDVTEKIRADEEILRRNIMLAAIASSTEELLSNPDIMDAISKSLPEIGKAVNVDRVYLFQVKYMEERVMTSSQRLEWNSGTAAPQIDNPGLQDVPLSVFEDFLVDLYHKKSFKTVISQLREGSALKKIMESEDIQSLLIIPIFIGDYFWGYVGYDECKYERSWAEEDISILKSFCNSIASAIDRARINEEFRNMALFAEENPDPLFRTDLEGNIILSNKTIESIHYVRHENVLYTFPEFARKVAGDMTPESPYKHNEVESEGRTYGIISLISQNKIHINNYAHNITELKKSQDELKRLSLVTSANRQGVHFTSTDFRITYTNEALLRMTGYSRDEMLGRTPQELFNGPLTKNEKLTEGHINIRPVDTDIIIYRKDRSWFWANIKTQPLEKKENGEQEFFSVIEDISEKKMAEEILINSENRLSTLILNLNEGILLEDENRKIVVTNSIFCKMFNIPVAPEYLQGADCSRSAEESKHLFKNPEEFVKRIDGILIRKEPVFAEELELANGMFYERDYIPVFINDIYKGHLWKYVDITARKNYERNLKLLEEKYRNIIDNMNMGLIETDLNDIIQSVNQQVCHMTGYTTDELSGKNTTDILISDNFRNLVREKNRSRAEGISDMYQLQITTKGGDSRWWLVSGAPNYNDEGQLVGIVGICLDITEQKILDEEIHIARKKAEESSKAKESFLANMSHEIRTPLNAIIGLIREISREPLTPDQNVYIRNAGLASQHLLSIVNDILDITKIEAGQLKLENRPFSLKEVISDAVALVMPVAREKMIRINMDISPVVAPVYSGDSTRLSQILINIINNSIKFTEKGSVEIECKVTGSTDHSHDLQILVKDTGIGMDESFLKNVFDKFSQGDLSAARKYGGTGLGMAIIHELVHLMNGTIDVKSKKGLGTTVEVNLTLAVSGEKLAQKESAHENNERLKKAHILMVEDNDLNRMVARNTLSYYGIRVTEAVNGFDAIEKLRQSDFDLILMDLQMPELDGMEATRIIRQTLHKTVPVIALTANAFKAEIERCMEAGMNDYITKPYEESVLLGAILRNLPLTSGDETAEEKPAGMKKHYNLENLINLSRGNKEFIRKMITLFIEQTPLAVDQIKTAWRNNDLDTVGKVAHKIKPTLDHMGIADLKEDIRNIELMAKEGGVVPELEELIDRLDDVLRSVVTELASELES